MSKIGVVDYGMGNLRSVQNAIRYLGYDSELVSDPDTLKNYEKIILPGVGAFSLAIGYLKNTGLFESLNERKKIGTPIFGICLGMQLMCSNSEEHGFHEGLNWIDAEVNLFPSALDLPVPHMGWNTVSPERESRLFDNIKNDFDAYFVHSYFIKCKKTEDILATSKYGIDFTAIFQRDNILGAQFHPEKSQDFGLQILNNFFLSKW